jgi:hypothetical protein
MTTRDRIFLIVFDREAGASTVDDLGQDLSAAMAVYAARERDVAEQPNLEVALIGSSSLETLRTTHSSYFGAAEALRPALAAAR